MGRSGSGDDVELRGGGSRNLPGVALMLAAAGGASLIPLVIKWASGEGSPFLFNAAWRSGVALGCLVILAAFYGGFVRREWRVLWRNRGRLLSWPVMGTVAGNQDYAFFSQSLSFIDVGLAVALIETYPVMVGLLLAFMRRGEPGAGGWVVGALLFLPACFAGFLFLSAGEAGGFGALFAGPGAGRWEIPVGVLLGLTGAAAVSCTAFTLRWCEDTGRDFASGLRTPVSGRGLALCCLVVALAFANLVSVPVNAAIGLAKGEVIGFRSLAAGVFVGGMLVQAVPSVAWRAANLVTRNSGVNAILYLTPVASLLWLWAFSHIGVAGPDYYAVGAAGILAASVLVNLEGERFPDFRAAALAFWACEVAGYLVAAGLGIWPGWVWPGVLVLFAGVIVLRVLGGGSSGRGFRHGDGSHVERRIAAAVVLLMLGVFACLPGWSG